LFGNRQLFGRQLWQQHVIEISIRLGKTREESWHEGKHLQHQCIQLNAKIYLCKSLNPQEADFEQNNLLKESFFNAQSSR